MSLQSAALVIVALLLGVYWYLKKIRHTYWKRKGVPSKKPEFYYGNFRSAMKLEKTFAIQFTELYKEFKNKREKHCGLYLSYSPFYVPIDIEIVKCIMQKDFSHFINRGSYYNAKDDPLSAHLFHLTDAKWRNLRTKLTPTFTSGKMKMMFQTLVQCSDGLDAKVKEYATLQDPVDVKEILARFATDVIMSCAFGLDSNSLTDLDSDFRKYGRDLFTADTMNILKQMLPRILPHDLLRKLGLVLNKKSVTDFFQNVVKDIVEYREKNHVVRKDFMHLLLQLRNTGKITEEDEESIFRNEKNNKNDFLTMNELSAQCFVFFVAGFETSSTAMTYALYELSINQDIQDKLREEIREVLKKHDNKITYDSIMEMSYLDKILNETFRLHTPVTSTMRICNEAFPVPGTNVVLEPGTNVNIPIYGIHMDPEYYPNPEVFDPERFTEENKAKRPACTFLPFGEGPRICIGMRFGLMQSKVGLVRIIKDYKVTLNKKTVNPLEYDPKSHILLLSVKGGVWLNFSKVN